MYGTDALLDRDRRSAEKIAEYREHKLIDWLKLLDTYFATHVGAAGFVVGDKARAVYSVHSYVVKALWNVL